MALEAGARLGPFEITGSLGAGGMGEVYRATDTKLKREVAIKVLPESFAADPERLARFQREAEVLASLNHPNIAAIYGLEDSGETHALVLELVEGPTLAELIEQRSALGSRRSALGTPPSGDTGRAPNVQSPEPASTRKGLPLEEVLPIARQIAEALEAAHERGIIHRDLKPANIKVTPEGVVKVLDFGLAKALEPARTDEDIANSPTMSMTAAATKMGMIMGTAAYMSPEQAKGRPVDKRTDIWAYGVVLFEMLTGTGAFQGEDVSTTLAKIIEREPDWAQLSGGTPGAIQRLLRRCLTKDSTRRIPDIGIARIEIDETLGGTLDSAESRTPGIAPVALWHRPIGVAAITLLAAGLIGLAVWNATRGGAVPRLMAHFAVTLPPSDTVDLGPVGGLALSPDGRTLVYVAVRDNQQQLFRREISSPELVPIRGTEEGNWPFFSPDGAWIGFIDRGGALKKVATTGGAAVTLAQVSGVHSGASWGDDGTILVTHPGGIFGVPDSGGEPELLVAGTRGFATGGSLTRPQRLRGGHYLMYAQAVSPNWSDAQIIAESLATGERKVLVNGGTDARYLPTGHLVFVSAGTILAAPFDPDTVTVLGGPVPLVEGVAQVPDGMNGLSYFAVSSEGTLAYVLGDGTAQRTLVWVDRQGAEEPLAAAPREYRYPRISPDGSKIVLSLSDQEQDLWVWEFARETLTRLTFAPSYDSDPLWTPDGRRVVFSSARDGVPNLYAKASDGTGVVERLTDSPVEQYPLAISPDGAHLVVERVAEGGTRDLYVLDLNETRQPEPLIATEFDELNAEISPDGRWLAYQSNASGRFEIYVQPFPNVDAGRWQISTGSGTKPAWGPDGEELFYLSREGLVGVSVQTTPSFGAGTPWLAVRGQGYYQTAGGRSYDIGADGRFLMIRQGAGDDRTDAPDEIHIVLNWTQELLERVPIP